LEVGALGVFEGKNPANKGSGFHCLFGPSQLCRLGPKRPRNTENLALYPGRRALSALLALGWYAFAPLGLLPLRGGLIGRIGRIGRIRFLIGLIGLIGLIRV